MSSATTTAVAVPGEPAWTEPRRTCLAYSPGGHLSELLRATAGIAFADCFHVTFASGRAIPQDGAAAPPRVYHLCHPRRSPWRTLANAAQALLVLLRERPRLVISTGADVAVPVVVLGKLLGATTVFVETGGTVEPSLAGRLCYPFSDLFLVQWPEKLAAFPKAVLADGLLL